MASTARAACTLRAVYRNAEDHAHDKNDCYQRAQFCANCDSHRCTLDGRRNTRIGCLVLDDPIPEPAPKVGVWNPTITGYFVSD